MTHTTVDRFAKLCDDLERDSIMDRTIVKGCTESEVQALADKYGLSLPEPDRLFLTLMGYDAGRLTTYGEYDFACGTVLTLTAPFYHDLFDTISESHRNPVACNHSIERGSSFTMKQLSIFLVILSVRCGDDPPPESSVNDTAALNAHAETMNEDVTLTVNVIQFPEREAETGGTTNLLKGTQLIIIVNGRVEGAFQQLFEVFVSADGKFGPASVGTEGGLDDGEYVVNVTMPMPLFQPPAVKELIGATGEHLTGPLVRDGAKGFTVLKEFAVGTGQSER